MSKTATIIDAPAEHDRRERGFLGRAISARRSVRRLLAPGAPAAAETASARWGEPQRSPAAKATAPRSAARDRAAAQPLDQATYACLCGEVFRARVSTAVRCPRCGAAQAW